MVEAAAGTEILTHRVVPVRCFQCGMPINHKVQLFDDLTRDGILTPLQAFERLEVARPCCRVVLSRTADDCRLRRRLKEPQRFAKATSAPPSTRVYTMLTDGSVDALDEHVTMPAGTST